MTVKNIAIISVMITFSLLAGGNLSAVAQTTFPSVTIEELQRQILKLSLQIQTLQKELSELKTETGIQSPNATMPVGISETAGTGQEEIRPATPPEFTRSLFLGARGDDVRKLQEFLASDKNIYPEGLITGYYGPKTADAIKRWQGKNNIEVVGVVGPKTIAKFRELGQGAVQGLIQQGTPSGMVPQGLMMAPGIQRQMATTTPVVIPPIIATTTPVTATTTPAIPAEPATPATPAVPGATSAVPATPATPASTTASNELKVTYPNGGETWYKGNAYTITWQNPLVGGFTGKEKYYWNVLLKRGNTAWQADSTVPVTQSSYAWSKWTGWAEPIPNAADFKVGISLVDTCAAQVGGSCPSANISITPSGGIDYSDGYFTATSTPPATSTSAGDTVAPSTPTNLTVVSSGQGFILNWTDNSDTETVYAVYMRSSGTTNWMWIKTISANVTTFSDTASIGTYEFRVYACSTGYSRFENPDTQVQFCAGSNIVTSILSAQSTTTTTDLTPPIITLAVGYPNLTAQTQPVYVGFSASEEVKVIYEYGLTTSYGSIQTVWDQYWTANGAYLPTLSSGATYHIRAKATDRSGNIGYSQNYTFTTASPNSPPVITSGPHNTPTDATPKEAILVEFATNIACLGTIQYGTTSTYPFDTTKSDNLGNQTSHSFFLTGLLPNTTYYYQVNCSADSGSLSVSGSYTTGNTINTTSPATATTTSAVLNSINGLLEKLLLLIQKR